MGGASAGAALAMGLAYFRDQTMINETLPWLVNSSSAPDSITILAALGSLDYDKYFALPTNPLPVIRGVLNCWGGILLPMAKDGGDDNGTMEQWNTLFLKPWQILLTILL